MNCTHCGSESVLQVHGQQHFQCGSCNFVIEPDCQESTGCNVKPTGRQTGFTCPNCKGQSLEVALIDESQVCYCDHCQGFVVDSETLSDLVRELRIAYEGPEDKPLMIDHEQIKIPTHCPACFEQMNTHPYYGPGNVVIDSCGQCKLTWLDCGELAKIVRAPGRR